jgi:sec-independent protein translocase protein TatB
MFGIDSSEILIIAVVALVVIGPKDLPRAMRTIGNFVGRARGMAKHFRAGFDTMIREAELEDMEKFWKAENERIMREHPQPGAKSEAERDDGGWAAPPAGELPLPAPAPAAAAAKPRSGASRPKPPPVTGPALPSGAAPPLPAPDERR